MRRKKNILEYFSEGANMELRDEIESSITDAEAAELDLLKHIWSESEELEDHFQPSTESAWEKVSGKLDLKEDTKPSATVVATPETAQSEPRKAKVIPFRRYATAAAAAIVILIAARVVLQQEQPDQTMQMKTFVSMESAVSYAFDNLFPIAEELMLRAEDENFENKVYAMAGERFDGETNVLVKNILGQEAETKHWKTQLASFQNIQGNNYFPQIYIPDYADYQTKRGAPVIIFYLTDQIGPEGYEYTAYHIQDGKLEPFGSVDEERLQGLKVWVLSINENVDNNGRMYDMRSNTTTVSTSGKSGRIDKMAIYDPKESWAGGASEVRVRAYIETMNGLDADGRASDIRVAHSANSPAGVPVRSFTREEINGKQMVELKYVLHEGWDVQDFEKDGVQLSYVIFEADVWPNTAWISTQKLHLFLRETTLRRQSR